MKNCPFDFLIDFDNWWYWHLCVIYWKVSEEWATILVKSKKDWKPVVNPSSYMLVMKQECYKKILEENI